jgi:hypothetical protein
LHWFWAWKGNMYLIKFHPQSTFEWNMNIWKHEYICTKVLWLYLFSIIYRGTSFLSRILFVFHKGIYLVFIWVCYFLQKHLITYNNQNTPHIGWHSKLAKHHAIQKRSSQTVQIIIATLSHNKTTICNP